MYSYIGKKFCYLVNLGICLPPWRNFCTCALADIYKNILSNIAYVRKKWKKPKSLSTVEYIRQLCSVKHKVVKVNRLYTSTWNNVDNIILNEKASCRRKHTVLFHSYKQTNLSNIYFSISRPVVKYK